MNKQSLLKKLRAYEFPEKIINAFDSVKREDFIPVQFKIQTYEDTALPIGYGQTISQPYTIAFMLNLLELKNNLKILEVGSGSGYVLALLNNICKDSKIYGIERIKNLVECSKRILKSRNIKIVHKNGFNGFKKEAPFDRILVSASCKKISQKLVQQLKIGGVLVVPVETTIISLKRAENKNRVKEFPGFKFVPLIANKNS